MSPLDRLRWVAAVARADLPGFCTRLAVALADAASDGTGTAWRSRRNIAAALRVDEARIPKAFQKLQRAGFLVRGQLDGPVGRQTYRWHLTESHAEKAPPSENAPGAKNAPGAECAPPAETAPPPRAETASPGGAETATNGGRKPPHNGRREGRREEEVQEEDQNFEKFWRDYAKKTGKSETLKVWSKLNSAERQAAAEAAGSYVRAHPDPKYRKDPVRFLKGRLWEDEPLSLPDTAFEVDPWTHVRAEAWARSLIAGGCKIGPGSWPAWKALSERWPTTRILEIAANVPATERFSGQVEEALRAAGTASFASLVAKKTRTLDLSAP